MNITVVQIARVCHEANREYCAGIGDITQVSWGDVIQWQDGAAIGGILFNINELKAGRKPEPSALHTVWMKQKLANGWTYGPVKDAIKKEHPCIIPYGELPVEQRLKDYIFAAIVQAFFDCGVV